MSDSNLLKQDLTEKTFSEKLPESDLTIKTYNLPGYRMSEEIFRYLNIGLNG